MSDKPKRGDVMTLVEPDGGERQMLVTDVSERASEGQLSTGYVLEPLAAGILEKMKREAVKHVGGSLGISRDEIEAACRSGYRWEAVQDHRPHYHHGLRSPERVVLGLIRPPSKEERIHVLKTTSSPPCWSFSASRRLLLPVPPEPTNRGKRGQKLNRGGRRRARATHAEELAAQRIARTFMKQAANFGASSCTRSDDQMDQWSSKTGEEIVEELLQTAASVMKHMDPASASGRELDSLAEIVGVPKRKDGDQ